MNIMLVGGISMMMRSLSIKLHKEGHRLYVLTGSRNPGNHYPHAFERYDFPYDSPSVEEVFQSMNSMTMMQSTTILMEPNLRFQPFLRMKN